MKSFRLFLLSLIAAASCSAMAADVDQTDPQDQELEATVITRLGRYNTPEETDHSDRRIEYSNYRAELPINEAAVTNGTFASPAPGSNPGASDAVGIAQ